MFSFPPRLDALACAVALALPGAALAQEITPEAASPQACVSIESDAARLACYDAALGRDGASPQQADATAEAAETAKDAIADQSRQDRQAQPRTERARRAASDLFRQDDREPAIEAQIANAGKGSLLDSRWELAKDSKLGTFNFRAYKPVYLLPAFWSSDPNERPTSSDPDIAAETQDLQDVETKFQVSFKTKALENVFGDNGDLWMAYTQSSRWQVYDGDNSRPFRETNYEPEILLVFRNNYSLGGWKGRLFGIGVNHQSNGRADPLSRSWNRVMLNVGLDRENWALMLRPWWRIPDGENDDENPDIEDYVGRGDLTLVHRRGGHEFSLMARHSLRGGDDSRGAAEFTWGFPLHGQLRGQLQIFDGYGESLIDYDHRATYIGLGVSLLDWY